MLVFSGASAFAQDPEFTQFYSNPLYLNPAFAGTARCPRMVMNYRNQWPSLSGTFVTSSASYDQHVESLLGGLGLLVTSDKAGEATYTTSNFSAIYSYQLNITRRLSLKAGFQGTYAQKNFDVSKATFGDMIDKKFGFIYPTADIISNPSRQYFDFSAGLLAYSTKYYGGFAVHHIAEPTEGFISPSAAHLPRKYTVHMGAMIPLEKSRTSSTFISPNILFQQQQKFQQLNLGMYINRGPLVGGLWYRYAFTNSDALIILLGIQQGIFKFGYSYDITISKLKASGGSHEFSFGTQFECKPKRKRFRTVSCPSF